MSTWDQKQKQGSSPGWTSALGCRALDPPGRAGLEHEAKLDGVGLRDTDGLVHDNVTGTAHGKFACCNGTHAPVCKPRDTLTRTYNQGMFLGATVDMHALTGEAHYLALGATTLDAVVAKLTRGADADADGMGMEAGSREVGRAQPASGVPAEVLKVP